MKKNIVIFFLVIALIAMTRIKLGDDVSSSQSLVTPSGLPYREEVTSQNPVPQTPVRITLRIKPIMESKP